MKHITLLLFLLTLVACDQQAEKNEKPIIESTIENESKSELTYYVIAKNVLTGDFDGDGKEDQLNESLISSVNNKSIDSLPQIDYDPLVEYIHKKLPVLTLKSNTIPELFLTKNTSFGLKWIKNEGDLDKDGADEISIIIDWADWSQVNKCMVYSLKNNKWVQFAKFDVREWQITDNPNFNGFITKTKNGDFEVATFDSEIIEVMKPLNSVLVLGADSQH